MSKLLITFTFLLGSLLSIAQPTILRIDPLNAMGGTPSQVFEDIKYIPLETTKESLFGKIDQLEVTDKYFVVLDKTNTNSILIFDKTGKFHSKIEGGDVNMDYRKRIYSLNINTSTNQIEYRTAGSDNIFSCNFEGLKMSEKLNPFEGDVYFNFPDDVTAWYNYEADITAPDSIDHEIRLTKNNEIYKEYLPYNMKRANLTDNEILDNQHDNFYATANDTSALFLKPYDYNIYEITPHTFVPKFTLVLPLKNTLPNGFSVGAQYNGKRFQIFQDNNDLVYNIANTYLLRENLFFKIQNFGGLVNQESFVYNLKSGKLICVNRIVPDASNYFLPIAGSNAPSDSYFLTSNKNYLYTTFSSLAMFAAKEETSDKKPVYPPVLKNYFKTESRMSNPVIVQLRPKEDL